MGFPERPRYTSGGPPSMGRNPASRRALYEAQEYEELRSTARALAELRVMLESLEGEAAYEIAARRHIGGVGPAGEAYAEAVAAGLMREVFAAPDPILVSSMPEFRQLADHDLRFRPMYEAYVEQFRRHRRNRELLELMLIVADALLIVVPLFRFGRIAAAMANEARVATWLERLASVAARLRRIMAGADALAAARSAARRLLAARQAAGTRVVVNVGGTGEVAGAINLNPNVVAARSSIPEHVGAAAEDMGQIFPRASIDEITSNNLPPNTLDWNRILPGAHETLKPGGRIVIRFRGGQGATDGPIIVGKLEELGFRNVRNWADGAVVEAIRGP